MPKTSQNAQKTEPQRPPKRLGLAFELPYPTLRRSRSAEAEAIEDSAPSLELDGGGIPPSLGRRCPFSRGPVGRAWGDPKRELFFWGSTKRLGMLGDISNLGCLLGCLGRMVVLASWHLLYQLKSSIQRQRLM